MNWKHALFAVGYFLVFMASALALMWWQRRKRKTRRPFGDDFKLLRGPGESQFRLYLKREENELLYLAGATLVPVLVGQTCLQLVTLAPQALKLPAFIGMLLAFGAAFWLSARWYARHTQENFNRYLGYFGERIVAEHLEPLKASGWRILHDVPFENNGTKFNFDHVAIGPQGVFVIETKTYRKGSARPGFDDHKVVFDGRDLEWPWGKDNDPLEQAERNAMQLAKAIKSETGEHAFVTPILALPGWFVELRSIREGRLCRVTNPKGLSKYLPAGPAILNAAKITAFASMLENRCRDVTY